MSSEIETVAIDTGNGKTKIAFFNKDGGIHVDVFNSVVLDKSDGRAQMDGTEVDFFTYQFGTESYTVFVNGGNTGKKPIDLLTEGGYEGPAIKALFITALLRNGFSGKKINFISNLPIADFFKKTPAGLTQDERKTNKKLDLLDLSDVKYFSGSESGYELPKLSAGNIFAEGAAALIDEMISDDGTKQQIPDNIQIVDIGSGTIDVCVAHSDLSITTIQTESIGVSYLLEKLRDNLFDNIPQLKRYQGADRISLSLIEKWYDQKIYTDVDPITKEKISVDISQNIRAVTKEYCNLITRKIKIKDSVSDVFLLGGGALNSEIVNELKNAWPSVYVPESPQFSNVKGLLKLEKFLREPQNASKQKKPMEA